MEELKEPDTAPVNSTPAGNDQSVSGATGTVLVIGIVLAVLQAILYASMGIFGKLLYATGLGPEEVVILRFLCATILLGAFLIMWRKQALVSRQPAVYLQAVFFFLSALFYFYAVSRLTAGMTTVIFYTYPAVVALGSTVFFKERLTLSTVLALLMALGGLVLVSGMLAGGIRLDSMGIVWSVISCVSFAIYTLLIHKTARTEGPLTVTFTLSWTSLIAACVVFMSHVPFVLELTPQQIGLGCGLSLACTIIPIVLYIEAVKRIGATKTSLIGISETPFSLLFAFLILGEVLTLQQGIGSALIIASIAVITIGPLLAERKRKEE